MQYFISISKLPIQIKISSSNNKQRTYIILFTVLPKWLIDIKMNVLKYEVILLLVIGTVQDMPKVTEPTIY